MALRASTDGMSAAPNFVASMLAFSLALFASSKLLRFASSRPRLWTTRTAVRFSCSLVFTSAIVWRALT